MLEQRMSIMNTSDASFLRILFDLLILLHQDVFKMAANTSALYYLTELPYLISDIIMLYPFVVVVFMGMPLRIPICFIPQVSPFYIVEKVK